MSPSILGQLGRPAPGHVGDSVERPGWEESEVEGQHGRAPGAAGRQREREAGIPEPSERGFRHAARSAYLDTLRVPANLATNERMNRGRQPFLPFRRNSRPPSCGRTCTPSRADRARRAARRRRPRPRRTVHRRHASRTPAARRRTSSSSTNRQRAAHRLGRHQSADRRAVFDALFDRVEAYLSEREAYALDCYVGADPRYRLPIRVYTEFAWHSLFAHHLFITPEKPEPGLQPGVHRRRRGALSKPIRNATDAPSTFILVNFAGA